MQNAQTPDTGTRMVLTNCPDHETAQEIATSLVELKLAACVNILSPAESVYRWQDEVQSAMEYPVLIKCRADQFDDIRDRILDLHPYELPEIIAVPIVDGLDAYIAWLKESVL